MDDITNRVALGERAVKGTLNVRKTKSAGEGGKSSQRIARRSSQPGRKPLRRLVVAKENNCARPGKQAAKPKRRVIKTGNRIARTASAPAGFLGNRLLAIAQTIKKSKTPIQRPSSGKGHISGFVISALEKVHLSRKKAKATEKATDDDDGDQRTCFVTEMYENFRKNELLHVTSNAYLAKQKHVDESIRNALVNWITNVHFEFRLRPETLFLAINILDRYIEHTQTTIPQHHIIDLGISCLMLASKYEEIYCPNIKSFVAVTDGQVDQQELVHTEKEILDGLSFELTVPTAFTFLKRFLYIASSKSKVELSKLVDPLAHYFCESTLQLSGFLNYLPSHVAAASVSLAMQALEEEEIDASEWFGYETVELEKCTADLKRMILSDSAQLSSSNNVIRRKYSLKRFKGIAKIAASLLR